mmetsp:Transcript_1196/g.2817  ORF Transcript_1196/g.2817 Transcript_1196/m.2817 type:complete len:331 (+) Transcript_1196:84-1076(+)
MLARSQESFRRNMDHVPVPQDFCCSITGDIMLDPVCTADGHTYERVAIARWLNGHETSPKTNSKLESKTLTPNHALRCAIDAYLKERPEIERQQQDIAYACEVHEDEVVLKLSRKEEEIQALMNEVNDSHLVEQTNSASEADSFEDMSLSESLLRGIYSEGLETPSIIQRYAIQPIVNGQDLVVRAMYGWGNTTAFTIAALQTLDSNIGGCQAIIVVRTPEVARKVYMKCMALGQYLTSNCDWLQLDGVEETPEPKHLAVTTLHDCLGLLRGRDLRLESCRLLILDEADAMLQSKETQVYSLLKHFPRFTQLVLFFRCECGDDALHRQKV